MTWLLIVPGIWELREWNNLFENVLMFITYQTKCLRGFIVEPKLASSIWN